MFVINSADSVMADFNVFYKLCRVRFRGGPMSTVSKFYVFSQTFLKNFWYLYFYKDSAF